MNAEQPSVGMMYCDPCGDDREFRHELRDATVEVRGEAITVQAPTLVCTGCGEAQPDLSGGVDSIQLANDEYRRRHGMLTSDDLRRVREQYGLSREALAAVSGMSPATLYKYERGALQDELPDLVLSECDDPSIMERRARRRRDRLTPLQFRRFQEALAEVKEKREAEVGEVEGELKKLKKLKKF